ncbi:CPBP family intramembrane glutamic endopeptidase [Clostridium sp. UBA7503]|uniref:CPBP family intramembrane glutamic endopeptidase n=1 Tax=Clostridium sp. UBA7503 TaxID=1946377 RepID=UPI0032161EC4
MKKTDFFRFENKNDDFPFYNSEPSVITFMKGLFLLAISIGSVLFFYWVQIPSSLQAFINLAFPLAALILVVDSNWTKLFRKIYFKDMKVVIIALAVSIIYAMISGVIMAKYFGANANPVGISVQTNSIHENILLFLRTIPMLLGEELITIIPFLVILQFFTKVLKTSRKKAVVLAWIISAVIFGALHLPTYSWNLIQSVLGISVARLILTFTYVKTKNIWISFLVHISYDWCLFLIPVLLK